MTAKEIKADFEIYRETKSLDENFEIESISWTDLNELEECDAWTR